MRLLWRVGTALRKREQNNGITVIATTNEASSDRQKASANAENRNLAHAVEENDGEEIDHIDQRRGQAPPG